MTETLEAFQMNFQIFRFLYVIRPARFVARLWRGEQ